MSTYAVPTRGELPGAWVENAACAGHPTPDLWYAISGARIGNKQATPHPAALRICRACPVRNNCLQSALDNRDDWGLWGGTTPDQRRAMLRRR